MRQFVCSTMPDSDGSIVLSAKESRYLLKVLRQVDGDIVDVRLKDGRLVKMQLSLSGKNPLLKPTADVSSNVQGVQASELAAAADGVELWLFQFMTKPQKMDLIVRQATECGVTKIVPIAGDFSVKAGSDGRGDRWERIIREARQQSGSPVSTQILPVVPVEEAAEIWKKLCEESSDSGAAFVLHESPEYGNSVLFDAVACGSTKKAAVAVGCEGGMSERELIILEKAGFMPIHFVTNVLRAETAALYGIAVIQQFLAKKDMQQ